jgi:PAS domain S-box-containing protein
MTHVRMATKAKCIAGNQKSLLRLPINIESEADLLCNLTKGHDGGLSLQEDVMIVPPGLINFWNPGAVRIFGFTAEEVVGHSLDLIIPENLRARHWTGYNRVMATGESHYGQGDLLSVPGLTKDGRRISVEFSITLLHDEGNRPIGTAAILRDVTEHFEESRKLRRELAEFTRAG